MMRTMRLITCRAWLLVGMLVVLVLVWALFHRQITHRLAVNLILQSKNPSEQFFEELAKQPDNPGEFLARSWATGRVPHRQLVAAFLKEKATTNSPWSERIEPLVLAGTADGDLSVRELALATMEARRDARLFECARSQLADIDPMVRLLGLDYLRRAAPQDGVPILMKLLDDADLRVVTGAEVALMHWSGED